VSATDSAREVASAQPAWPEAEERYDHIRQALARHLPPPADVADLGAAPGVLSVSLARAGYRVTAVDLGEASDGWGYSDPGGVAGALDRAGIPLVICDLDRVPYSFADSSFDGVVMSEILEHLREYPLESLREVHRMLRPGGLLVLTTPNAAAAKNRVRLLVGKSIYTHLSPDWLYGLPHARHAREYTADELTELLRCAGFEPFELAGRHFHLRSGRRSPFARVTKRAMDRLGRVRPALAPNLAVLARRPN
jgi:2-polyprenyl-3-methyl-5-hydroxy-6-metoxy-1,4-benzoquinol methylase